MWLGVFYSIPTGRSSLWRLTCSPHPRNFSTSPAEIGLFASSPASFSALVGARGLLFTTASIALLLFSLLVPLWLWGAWWPNASTSDAGSSEGYWWRCYRCAAGCTEGCSSQPTTPYMAPCCLLSGRPELNRRLGGVLLLVYALLSYLRCRQLHHRHHRWTATSCDPDHHPATPPGDRARKPVPDLRI